MADAYTDSRARRMAAWIRYAVSGDHAARVSGYNTRRVLKVDIVTGEVYHVTRDQSGESEPGGSR